MDETIKSFRLMVRNAVLPFYATNDKGHQIDHADSVCNEALYLIKQMDVDKEMMRPAIVAAYCHDMFSKPDKETRRMHHESAFAWVVGANVPWLNCFDDETRMDIALACREHRASWKGGYSSQLSTIIATADRGRPNIDQMLYRAAIFGVDTYNYTPTQSVLRAIFHIREKFGADGYAKCPELWRTMYSNELAQLRNRLDALCSAMYATPGVTLELDEEDTQQSEMTIDVQWEVLVNARLPDLPINNALNGLYDHLPKSATKFLEYYSEHFYNVWLRNVMEACNEAS